MSTAGGSGGRAGARLPSLSRRALAGSIDLLVFGTVSAALVATGVIDVSRWMTSSELLTSDRLAVTLHATAGWTFRQWLFLWLPIVIGHALFGALERSTPGAWLAGVELVDGSGTSPSPLRGVLRGALYTSWPATFLLAPVLCAFLPSQRGLHDLLSGTWVVARPQLRSFRMAPGVPVREDGAPSRADGVIGEATSRARSRE